MKREVLTRREFTRESVLALLSGVVITVTGCSSGSSSPTGSTPPPSGGDGVSGTVSANHGHAAFVSNAQITAANNISLDIRGSSDHSHTVDLTGAELTQIGNRQRVVKTSTVSQVQGTHSHNVTFN